MFQLGYSLKPVCKALKPVCKALTCHVLCPVLLLLLLQIQISESLQLELESLALGTAVDKRDINAIVNDLLASDEDLEEAELPLFARRNPVVAAAAVSGAH